MPAEWPSIARITRDVEIGARNDVRRTEFDDGAIRQAKIYSAPQLTWQVTALIRDRHIQEWMAWVAQYGAGTFDLRAPHDGHIRHARIRGGAGGVRTTWVGAHPPSWEATMVLEAPGAPFLAPNLWDDDVHLGHTSHVYARSTVLQRTIDRPGGGYYLDLTPDPAQQLDPVFIAPGTPAVTIATVWAHVTSRPWYQVQFRLARPGEGGGVPGPDLLAAARPGLTHVWQMIPNRPLFLPGGTGGADTTDPYVWPTDSPEYRAMLQAARAAGTQNTRNDPTATTGVQVQMRWALVWSGAGSVIDLVLCRSRQGGAAPVIAADE